MSIANKLDRFDNILPLLDILSKLVATKKFCRSKMCIHFNPSIENKINMELNTILNVKKLTDVTES